MRNSTVSEELRRCREADAERIRRGEQDAFLNSQGARQRPAEDWRDLAFKKRTFTIAKGELAIWPR